MPEKIAELLGLDDMTVTVRGDEIKYYVDGSKRYLSAADCVVLSEQFAALAKRLRPREG